MVLWKLLADWCKSRPAASRLADRLGRGQGRFRWLDRVLSRPRPAQHKPDFTHWDRSPLSAVAIGHATVLIRIGGKTVLTDPVMAHRIGVGLGLVTGGPSRLIAPAVSIRDLPKLDLILISHAHFDHLDRPTLARLPRTTPIITAAKTRDLLDDLGFTNVTELAWGQSVRMGDLNVRSCEVKHWGARTFHDDHRHACAFLLEADGRRVLFGGDTAYGRHFTALGKVDLAVLGIGAYNPWVAGHATPEQALRMADDVRAEFIMPMHHSTFRLSHEPMDEPLDRLMRIVHRDRIAAPEVGMSWSLN